MRVQLTLLCASCARYRRFEAKVVSTGSDELLPVVSRPPFLFSRLDRHREINVSGLGPAETAVLPRPVGRFGVDSAVDATTTRPQRILYLPGGNRDRTVCVCVCERARARARFTQPPRRERK